MIRYPDFDPVAISLGPLDIRWYGLMYLLGFLMVWLLALVRVKRPGAAVRREQLDDMVFYGAIGAILGGRLGYTLFYGMENVIADPLSLFRIWEGGMSFHGGLLGVIVALWYFARRIGRGFFEVTDFVVPLIPPGLGAGRIGNFINGELWGKPTDAPWGFVVDGTARHASQLYQALLEGLVLFVCLWLYSARPRPTMAVSGLFALLYGIFRFGAEFVRLPDEHLGYLAFGWVTMGQLLSVPLIVFGIFLLIAAYRRGDDVPARA
ncbi:MAG: prolipoprotein diacylglyceryl transferase [Gammaproteobacteria bacterium]|nr:prolipoprotein diacylglyceryl transferase [Gammaproteobacteria bacterium]